MSKRETMTVDGREVLAPGAVADTLADAIVVIGAYRSNGITTRSRDEIRRAEERMGRAMGELERLRALCDELCAAQVSK